MRKKRGIGRDHRDARAVLAPVDLAWNFLAHRHACDGELGAPAEVGLHENADRETARRCLFLFLHLDAAGGGAGSAFEFITNHPGSSAYATLVDRAPMRGVERVENVLGLHVETVHIVQPTVPGLCDNRKAPEKSTRIGTALFDAPIDNGIAH